MKNENKNSLKEKMIMECFNGFARKYWTFVMWLMPMIAYCDSASFKSGLQAVLGIVLLIAFCLCVFFLIEGVYQYRQGGNFGKDIIGVAITAGALALVGALFAAFGMSSAELTPTW